MRTKRGVMDHEDNEDNTKHKNLLMGHGSYHRIVMTVEMKCQLDDLDITILKVGLHSERGVQ